eukprot:s10840_g2.t1
MWFLASIVKYQKGVHTIEKYQKGVHTIVKYQKGVHTVEKYQKGVHTVEKYQKGVHTVEKYQKGVYQKIGMTVKRSRSSVVISSRRSCLTLAKDWVLSERGQKES